MRIVFLPTTTVSDISNRISREQSIYDSLKSIGHHLICIPPVKVKRNIKQRLMNRLWKIAGFKYRPERSPYILKKESSNIENQLNNYEYDIVFSLGLHTSYLRTNKPMINWGDAVFSCIVNFYSSHTKMDPISIYQGNKAEELSLRRCDLSIFTSNWAANCAARYYKFPLDKLRVVPRGAVLPDVPDLDEILLIRRNKKRPLTAILVGSEWDRKGGRLAWETICILNKKGYLVSLITIGMIPPKDIQSDFSFQSLPFLRKENPSEWDIFKKAMIDADFMILPSIADFTPNAIAEAYAFGLPVIASGIGAIPEMIDHESTGFVIHDKLNVNEFACCIERFILQKDLIIDMSIASRKKFDNEMNMNCSAKKLSSLFEYVLYHRCKTISKSHCQSISIKA